MLECSGRKQVLRCTEKRRGGVRGERGRGGGERARAREREKEAPRQSTPQGILYARRTLAPPRATHSTVCLPRSVQEVATCSYSIRFASPAACVDADVEAVRERLQVE